MIEPAFSFTIPSLHDDIPLDCRIYHPKDIDAALSHDTGKSRAIHGAVIAHPYAPLGGSFDDAVVLAVARCLLREGLVVGTFNFRGASGSKGSTSWTGRSEREDYAAFAGFMVYYISRLQASEDSTTKLNTIYSQAGDDSAVSSGGSAQSTKLLLAGYSYGSLILSRLPPISSILERFEVAERGTSAAEIVLRARRLAQETEEIFAVQQNPASSRGRQLEPPASLSPTKQRMRPSPVVVGGEETDPSERRRSRDSRRSVDIVRKSVEAPKRIKAHIRRRSSGQARPSDVEASPAVAPQTTTMDALPSVSVKYLLISPVLPPLSHTMVSPAALSTLLSGSKGAIDQSTGIGALRNPTLVLWGSSDSITSGRRLRSWAEKLATQAPALFTWKEFDKVGHFWREEGALKALHETLSTWVRSDTLT